MVADAIMFVPSVSQEIYASPASALINYEFTDSSGGQHQYQNTPVVYIGTVDSSMVTGNSPPDWGSVHCVNSATPTTNAVYDTAGNAITTADSTLLQVAQKLGTDLWVYPNPNPMLRKPYQGPVVGGFYASPLVVNTQVINGADTLTVPLCIMSGMDRQVYAFAAADWTDGGQVIKPGGTLIWKGPGVTQGLPDSSGWVGNWTPQSNRLDAFGGVFKYISCVDSVGSSAGSCTWDFTRHAQLRRA